MTNSPDGPYLHFSQMEGDEIDIKALLHTLWRGKLWIILAGFIGLAVGGYYAYVRAVPTYTASAVLMLESGQEQVVDFDSVVTGISGDQSSINTELQVMKARGLIEKLVLELDLTTDPEFNRFLRPPEKYTVANAIKFLQEQIKGPRAAPRPPTERKVLDVTINRVLGAIQVSNINRTYVFRITVTTQNRNKSALIANTLAELYIFDQVDVKFKVMEQATVWLTDRVAELRIELERSENAVKEFNAETDLISVEALAALDRQLKDVRERQANFARAAETQKANLKTLQEARASGDRVQMARVAEDPSLERLLDIIDQEDSNAESLFDSRFELIILRVEQDTERAEAQKIALTRSLANLAVKIDLQTDDFLELQQLRREAEANGLLYEYFLGRLKETSVQQGIQQADSRLLSSAVIPGSPSAPRKSRILALSLLLGIMAGTSIILVREMSQTGIRTVDQLEKLTGLTVMGQIPKIPARRRKNVLEYLIEKPNSASAEAVRNLRTSTLLSNVDEPPKIIMSTSSLPGEGKTTQSLALAQNFAGLGQKVLLVEGDIRRRVFSQYFDISAKSGLLSVLSGEAELSEVVVHDDKLRADILIGEKSSTNAADVFSSKKFSQFLEKSRETYDVIIIDTPPVLVVSDARVIGQFVDAVLYTVKWDSTTRNQIREGLRMFETVNVKVTGLVLGQIDAKGMKRYGYGGEYGAYGAYGTKYYHN